MYGWKIEEIKGKNISKVLQTSFNQSNEEVIQEFFTTGIWQGEVVQYTKTKQKLYIYSLVKLIKDPLGQQDLVVAVNRNITEKVEFKNKYYRSEETFELAINAVDDGLWDWNIETGKVYYSPRWAHILGFKPEEVVPEYQSWISRIHQEDTKLVEKSLQEHLQGEVSQFVCEHRLKRKDGTFLWVLGRGKVVESKKGTPLRAIGTMTDISKRKEYEEKILRITKEQKQILEGISDGFIVLDNDLTIRMFNTAAEKLLGRTQVEVLDNNLFESFPEAKGSIFEEKYTQAIKTKQPTHFETYFNPPPYENWYDVRVYPHDNGISIFFQVVTEARKAQQLLEESLKEKEILLREIHHRIKNNLQIVSSLISLQSNRLEEPQLKQFLFNLETRIQSMSLIHKSLYESERLSNVNLKNYIEPLVQNIQSIYQKDVKLAFDVQEITLPIDIAVPLALIINEVVSNSFKHAFCLSEECQITLKLRSNETNYILSISDNGKGLPDNFNTEKNESMGFLLIDNLVEQLSGEISYNTNEGTVITICFPIEKESILE